MTRRLAVSEDGTLSFCTADEEHVGKGRCKHLTHQNTDENTEQFADRVEKALNNKVSEDNQAIDPKNNCSMPEINGWTLQEVGGGNYGYFLNNSSDDGPVIVPGAVYSDNVDDLWWSASLPEGIKDVSGVSPTEVAEKITDILKNHNSLGEEEEHRYEGRIYPGNNGELPEGMVSFDPEERQPNFNEDIKYFPGYVAPVADAKKNPTIPNLDSMMRGEEPKKSPTIPNLHSMMSGTPSTLPESQDDSAIKRVPGSSPSWFTDDLKVQPIKEEQTKYVPGSKPDWLN